MLLWCLHTSGTIQCYGQTSLSWLISVRVQSVCTAACNWQLKEFSLAAFATYSRLLFVLIISSRHLPPFPIQSLYWRLLDSPFEKDMHDLDGQTLSTPFSKVPGKLNGRSPHRRERGTDRRRLSQSSPSFCPHKSSLEGTKGPEPQWAVSLKLHVNLVERLNSSDY